MDRFSRWAPKMSHNQPRWPRVSWFFIVFFAIVASLAMYMTVNFYGKASRCPVTLQDPMGIPICFRCPGEPETCNFQH